MSNLFRLALFLVVLFSRPIAVGETVINELMYHPPGDSDDLQYVELHNPGEQGVNLGGWKLGGGVRFEFPSGTELAPGGYLVVARNPPALIAHYRLDGAVLGELKGRLSYRGESVVLVDETGRRVDRVAYRDRGDWPRAPDGYSASLERINPLSSGESPSNWASSMLQDRLIAAGTPGRQNDVYAADDPPWLLGFSVQPEWPAPGQPIRISCRGNHALGVKSATVLYRTASAGEEENPRSLPLTRTQDRFEGELPGEAAGSLLRWQILLEGNNGEQRVFPSDQEPRPAFSVYVDERPSVPPIGLGKVVNVGELEPQVDRFFRSEGESAPEPSRGNSAFIFYPGDDAEPALFDFIRCTPRRGGFKLRFHADRRWNEMSVVNFLSEGYSGFRSGRSSGTNSDFLVRRLLSGKERYKLSEHLSYELYRRVGIPAPRSGYHRIVMDGQPVGYLLTVEQVNRTFLKNIGRDPDGNLYKLLWYGRGVVEQHEKKTNRHEGYEDILEAISGLARVRGKERWQFIDRHFNASQFVDYYAVNMCLSNWDGFFNNYFAYHDREGSGKWEIYPWDTDKTWGDYDGSSQKYDWYDFPLTSGMAGDRPKSTGRFSFFRSASPFGGEPWWRPPGYFSGPMLVNSTFRYRFLQRLEVFCQTIFTEKLFIPIIDELEERLEPEVRYRAELKGVNVEAAEQAFSEDIESFRRQVRQRRDFILGELEKLGQENP